MEKKEIVNKLINETADRDYQWQKYNDNTSNFRHHFFENSQHFIPEISYVLQVKQGIFLLASFQAMRIFSEVTEEITLRFYKDNKEELEERIYDNSPDLYALRKLIELNIDNIVPNFDNHDPSDQIDFPSDALSDFLDS
ncbi:hypothetical protein [Enterococcus faecium]|uniref:hypothetical protein n=1 Tax=Enterococcus faecium TaxID=1352 RepID=UPI000BF227D1|nr:hypothetical protein [Enterococcus faecium]PEH49325.1 hypothetical protein CRM75_16235 [Enterococcus faecium]